MGSRWLFPVPARKFHQFWWEKNPKRRSRKFPPGAVACAQTRKLLAPDPAGAQGFTNFLQNFGDLSQFWRFWDFGIDFKILKKVCKDCSPIFWPILENFDFRIWVKSQSYDKPPWRNFVFLSKFEFRENRKFQILNPSSNPNFWSLTLNPNFRFWQICGFCSI